MTGEYSDLKKSSKAFIEGTGGYWPRDKILLQLAEEVGELIQADRKKGAKDVIEEAGDVLFTIMTFIGDLDIETEVVLTRIEKNIKLLKEH